MENNKNLSPTDITTMVQKAAGKWWDFDNRRSDNLTDGLRICLTIKYLVEDLLARANVNSEATKILPTLAPVYHKIEDAMRDREDTPASNEKKLTEEQADKIAKIIDQSDFGGADLRLHTQFAINRVLKTLGYSDEFWMPGLNNLDDIHAKLDRSDA